MFWLRAKSSAFVPVIMFIVSRITRYPSFVVSTKKASPAVTSVDNRTSTPYTSVSGERDGSGANNERFRPSCGFHAISLPHISRDRVIELSNVQRRTTHPKSLQRTATAVEELLTMPEVAELTRLPIATLRWYRATGQGGPKSGKVGGRRVMYRRADVEAWIQSAFEGGAA